MPKSLAPCDANPWHTLTSIDCNEAQPCADRHESFPSLLFPHKHAHDWLPAAGVNPSMTGETIAEEEEETDMTPDQLEVRIGNLLDTCTFTVFNYTRRGLFDRDKLIVLTLLTFQIMLREGKIDAAEYDALCKGARSPAPPPITDDLSRWMNEGQWAAVDALAAVPGECIVTTETSVVVVCSFKLLCSCMSRLLPWTTGCLLAVTCSIRDA